MDTKAIASVVVSEMSAEERATFTIEGWRQGLGWMGLDMWDGVDLVELAEEVEEAVIRAEATRWVGV